MNKLSVTLKEALDSLLPAAAFSASEKSPLPIHNFVLIKNLSNYIFVVATNGSQTLTKRVAPYLGDDFELCVCAKKLQAILGGLKALDANSPFNITWNEAEATVKVGRSKLVLGVICPTTFPSPRKLSESRESIFKSNILLDSINAVVHAIGLRHVHAFFNGLNIRIDAGNLSVISSDSHRLSRIVCSNIESTGDINAILPRRYIALLSLVPKNETIRLKVDNNMAEITWADGMIRTNLIDASYPDTRQHFSANGVNAFSVNRQSLLHALGRLNATVDDNRPALTISNEGGEVKLSTLNTQNSITGEDFIDADIESDFSFCINLKYLSDALSAFPDENISLQKSDMQGFISLKGITSAMTELIAPMRL